MNKGFFATKKIHQAYAGVITVELLTLLQKALSFYRH